MPHLRINEREANPNPHVNFISALPSHKKDDYSEDAARGLLRALAAQVKPIMKQHRFFVNSLEEKYEHNSVFLGRNWNAGETIELVLRNKAGSFYPTATLLDTFCHELAHIRYMHHLNDFQRLWAQLRREVDALRDKGYYGDGYWSAGTRLGDGTWIPPEESGEMAYPEYVCGGAQQRSRSSVLGKKRRFGRPKAGPSNHSGPQTEKKRKAGSRITSKVIFQGEGQNLSNGSGSSVTGGVGLGFRKRANSQKAKQERARLAEERVRLTKGMAPRQVIEQFIEAGMEVGRDEEQDDESETEETVPETDVDRRRHLTENLSAPELEGLKRFFPSIKEATPMQGHSASQTAQVSSHVSGHPGHSNNPRIIREERSCGRRISKDTVTSVDDMKRPTHPAGAKAQDTENSQAKRSQEWDCFACTFVNPALYLVCSICGTVRQSS